VRGLNEGGVGMNWRFSTFKPPWTVSQERSFWQYKVYADIRWGLLERGHQMRVWSLKMAIFAFFVHCLPNILHTWPHASLYVMRVWMTLAIYFNVIRLSHQIYQERCVIQQKLL